MQEELVITIFLTVTPSILNNLFTFFKDLLNIIILRTKIDTLTLLTLILI